MPTLRILVAGELLPPEAVRHVLVEGELSVGRDEACQVVLVEKRASRRHLRIVREPSGWVAEDLDSSNGTFVGEERILRRALEDGMTLRIGDTQLAWSDPQAPVTQAPALVGGRLALREVVGVGDSLSPSTPSGQVPSGQVPSGPAASDPAVAYEAQPDDAQALAGPLAPLTRPLDLRSFGRALTLAVLGLVAALGVGFVLGAKAQRAREETTARHQLADLLARSDVDAAAFEAEAVHYLLRFPDAPDRALLQRHLEALGARTLVRQGVEARFETLLARLGSLPEDQVRVGLLALKPGTSSSADHQPAREAVSP